MDGHPAPQGTDRIPPTGRLTVTTYLTWGFSTHSGASGAIRAREKSLRTSKIRVCLVFSALRSWAFHPVRESKHRVVHLGDKCPTLPVIGGRPSIESKWKPMC